MKQHKDIREILKRSGTAPTGICGFWRSAASFAAVLFGAFAAFKFLAGIYLGAGGLFALPSAPPDPDQNLKDLISMPRALGP